jgi:ATP-binding cassette subfamily F protein uup
MTVAVEREHMALISVREVSLGFGGPLLLEQVSFHVERGERVCLLGRNGTGKSTLFKLIAGDLVPDGGEITRQQGARIARLPQKVAQDVHGKTFDIVIEGLGRQRDLLAAYSRASAQVARDPSNTALAQLDRLHRQLDAEGAWRLHQEVERVLSHLSLDTEGDFDTLSGGLKRRVLLAKALVSQPDLLLLDEPTNHLDIASIEWLEGYLLNHTDTLLFVTHDRSFMRKLATRVIELDRGKLYDWVCGYDTFVQRKQQALGQEAREWELFDKKLAEEETWIRQGTQARTTRNQGQVKALEQMREARQNRRTREGTVRMQVPDAERTGKLVIEAEHLHFSYGEKVVIADCTATILRGDKVGVIGPNGSGKTTLLRLLLGDLAPQTGTLRHGTRLRVAYYDQMREQLDPDGTVQDNINDGNPHLTINGKARHVVGYLRGFLFPPERVQSRVRDLSGGERTRLMLARLFARPFNVLVMDEPTSDLDLETLELLEKLLIDYPGTLLLVSHDRTLLNNVVSCTFALEGKGQVRAYAGGYDDWLWQRPHPDTAAPKSERTVPSPTPRTAASRPHKISFQEQQELDALPERIEKLEAEQAQLYAAMTDPRLYQENGSEVARIQARLDTLAGALEAAYQRWEELDTLPQ